jgi:hypothetical protein
VGQVARRLPFGASRRLTLRGLVDESAPGFSLAIAENDAGAVGNSGNGVAIGIAEGVANGVVRVLFGRAAPDISKFIAQPQMIAVAESVQASGGGFFLEAEESARDLAMNPLLLEDALIDHPLQL